MQTSDMQNSAKAEYKGLITLRGVVYGKPEDKATYIPKYARKLKIMCQRGCFDSAIKGFNSGRKIIVDYEHSHFSDAQRKKYGNVIISENLESITNDDYSLNFTVKCSDDFKTTNQGVYQQLIKYWESGNLYASSTLQIINSYVDGDICIVTEAILFGFAITSSPKNSYCVAVNFQSEIAKDENLNNLISPRHLCKAIATGENIEINPSAIFKTFRDGYKAKNGRKVERKVASTVYELLNTVKLLKTQISERDNIIAEFNKKTLDIDNHSHNSELPDANLLNDGVLGGQSCDLSQESITSVCADTDMNLSVTNNRSFADLLVGGNK
jgi:hypothetical protein